MVQCVEMTMSTVGTGNRNENCYMKVEGIRNQQPFPVDLYLELSDTEVISTGRLLLQQQSVSRRTSAVPMAFSVYVRVHDVTVCWTAPTTQTNSTAVSTKLTSISCFTLLFISK